MDGLSDASAVSQNLPEEAPQKRSGHVATLSRNAAIGLVRVAVNSLVALVLPAYLTHRLPVTTYGAWVLILQLSAYVSFLDLGIQTGVSKFVSEYEARGDEAGAGRYASAGFAILTISGFLGLCLTFLLAWQVPRLFHAMPYSLYHDVRISVILVGTSLSFTLLCSVFAAIFLGLQRYVVPTTLAIVNRIGITVVILAAVALHGSLVVMGAAVAVVNVTTALLQVIAWRRMVSRIRVTVALVDYRVLKQMARYCSMLAIWSVGMLCVSGMDTTIVGHYDYNQTAYYAIAVLPTNFVLMIITSMLGPMMPASSALSTQRSASEMGAILVRITRYSTMLLLLTGLPLMVCGFPILRLWVGPSYALHCLTYLRILIFANILRNLCAPYSTMVVATGRLGAATVAAVSEALVNLGSSIFLASRFGAIGVAFGTLLGSVVTTSLHFIVSMYFTRQTLDVSRIQLFLQGMVRPAIMALPSILLLPFWWSVSSTTLRPQIEVLWGLSTLLLVWFGSLNKDERSQLIRFTKNRLALVSPG
jgi:O-antigen/teichoic acid export membrane protein